MDWDCQAVIPIYPKIWKNQILDHHECNHGVLSHIISSFCIRILHPIRRYRRNDKHPHFFTWWNFHRDHIWSRFFISCKNYAKSDCSQKPHDNCCLWLCFFFILLDPPIAAQAAYPPYGLASVSFTGLSCYLIYYRPLLFSCYRITGYSIAPINQKISNRAIKVA